MSWDREWGGRQRMSALPVTRAPPGGLFPRRAHRMWRVIHPERRRGNGTAPGDGFRSEERILGARDACGEGRKGAKKAREAFCPIARRCLFGQRASRVGNLPSEEKKVVCPAVALRFFQQKSNWGLDARHEKRGKGHRANQLSRWKEREIDLPRDTRRGTFILIGTLLRAKCGCFIWHLNKEYRVSNIKLTLPEGRVVFCGEFIQQRILPSPTMLI